MSNSVKIAIIQKPPVFFNFKESFKLIFKYLKESSENGAEIIVFPESWLSGYPVWLDYSPNAALWNHKPANELYKILAQNSISIPGKDFNSLLKYVKELSVSLILGANEIVGKTIYNTMIFINENGEYKSHRKLIPTYTERLVWGRGDGSTINTIESKHGTIGGLICWEHWMPLLRAAMHSKNETIHIAQWPTVKEMHVVSSRHYAFEGQCFVISAGTVLTKGEMIDGLNSLNLDNLSAVELLKELPGKHDDNIMKGGSCIIAPNGNFITEPLYNKSEIIYADIEPSKVIEGGIVIDTDGHYSRPDIFQLNVNTNPQINVNFSNGKNFKEK